ncbi:MAG: glycosyltransferase family 2 protein [Anaerolineales bacterium]|nr:glycosyltransferase family 2 protein [Anaerolineales bacterium]
MVIRAYNEERRIGRLLTGIALQTIQDIEIILVDSGSTDATTAIAARYNTKILHIRPDEFTFGRSLNRGIEQARSEIIVIASAHVYPVYPDWLERLLAPFRDPKVALAYGKQRGDEKTHFSEQQIFAHWFPEGAQPSQAHPFCNNANAAIRRELWEQRPYDETLAGLEDLEWASWAMDRGYAISYVPEAEVIHVHDETPRGVYNRYRREAMAFKRIFPEERFGLGDFLRLFSANAANDLWQATRQKLLWANLGGILWFRWMQFWGTYQGYRHSGPLTWQLRRTFYYPRQADPPSHKRPNSMKPIRYND